ncbi:MAG: DEAD/DEAH box helicase, partial [Gammaproteobacteria bacterium]|nr:DEAD/DEAH box helicase [Gammaproteobacteria bacterium]
QHSFPLGDVFHFLHPNTIKDTLIQAVLQAPLFTTRWRWTASRALGLVRFRNGKKVPPNILRMLSEDLLAAVFPDAAACQDNLAGNDILLPDHPLIIETMKDALNEALDIEGLTELLKKIISQSIHCIAVDTPIPSPFAHEILNANPYAFLDDAPLEERRARAVQMRQTLPDTALRDIGKLDSKAIKEVQQQAWPDIRNVDELQYAIQTFIIFPINYAKNDWQEYIDILIKTHRIGVGIINEKYYWFSAEKFKTVTAIYPNIIIQTRPADIDTTAATCEEGIPDMLRGWLLHLGPTTAEHLHNLLSLDISEIEHYLIRLESTGFVLRGHFLNLTNIANEWCERRLLSRIHRLTLNYLRNDIASVSSDIFFNWLLSWQHLSPHTQVSGEQGLIEIIRQLQGFEIPANAWEPFIFSKRVKDYSKSMLDLLCLTGVVGWGRLTTHPALIIPETTKRINPTSITPITFFLRENAHWIKQPIIQKENLENLHHIALDVYTFLKTHGASFFTDIVRGTNHLKAEVENGLWELVSAGLVTADSFDNLRALIDPKRRLNKKHKKNRHLFPLERHGSGRWSLLHIENSHSVEQIIEENCWVLLKRYGIVFRDLLEREKLSFSWRELLTVFRQLENRGEIRGGRFVHGFIGEQFALPYAVESLRTYKKISAKEEKTPISTIDPLNLYGIILPGNKISKISRKIIT